MKYYSLGTALALLVLAGCGGSGSSPVIPPGPVAGLLQQVTNPQQLEDSIKAGFTVIQTNQSTALASGGAADVSSFTGTYTQEENVDEFDAVRYDGEHLYVAPRKYLHCCYILAASADDGSNTGQPAVDSIRILETDVAGAEASVVSEIPLEDGISVQGMYIADDSMFALTAEAIYGSYGDAWSSISIWAPENLGYRVYDISNKNAPTLEIDVAIEGVFIESRRINNTVYIVSRYAPGIDGLVYNVQNAADQANNRDLLANVSLDDLLPSITINGIEQQLVDPDQCFIANDDRIVGYPVVTNITAVPIDDPAAFSNVCYNDDTYGAYVSESAIYFPQVLGYRLPDETVSRIHKFSLSGTAVDYRGSVDIEGQIWRGGQADFRMSEHDGELRVLPSIYRNFGSPDFVDHVLYVLRESPDKPELEIVSRLPNDARPEPIGKPNEELFGVRFLGDRAYAVTFQRIDPLYAIDLSNSADPRIAGELTISGFSDFLHPVNDDLLLGLGEDTVGAVKLELFDVSNLSQPLSRGAVTLGGQFSYSEARWDRHAFTYQPDVGGVDRFTIPASIYTSNNGIGRYDVGLHLFEIHGKATPALASLLKVGQMVPNDGNAVDWPDRNRAFIHDDTLFYVRDEGVWSAFWSSPATINGPF